MKSKTKRAAAKVKLEETIWLVRFIERNLRTTYRWKKSDYEDFYARDIELLLPLAKKQLGIKPAKAGKGKR